MRVMKMRREAWRRVIAGDDGDAREEHERERESTEEEDMEECHQGLLSRPRTPEPTMGMNMHDFHDEDDEDARGGVHAGAWRKPGNY